MGGWLEVNVGLENDLSLRERTLVDIVKPFIDRIADRIEAWHFLWQDKPWPVDKGAGITLRLRLMAEKVVIDEARGSFEKTFRELNVTMPDKYLGHCFGKHGLCGEEYAGESESWGIRGWALGIKFMQLGSELALELVANRRRLGSSEEFRSPVVYYADRWCHLFMNQIHALMATAGIDEGQFFLREAMTRLPSVENIREPVLALLRQLDEETIRARNIAIERPADFSQGLLDIGCRMQSGVASIGHEDPNLCLMAAISGLSAA